MAALLKNFLKNSLLGVLFIFSEGFILCRCVCWRVLHCINLYLVSDMRDKAWAHSGEVNQNSFSPLLTGLNMLLSLFHLKPSVLWLCLASPWLEDLRDLQASVTHQGLQNNAVLCWLLRLLPPLDSKRHEGLPVSLAQNRNGQPPTPTRSVP